ncbi:MAG: ATP-binding protein, partial [Propionivibrio sp.]
AWAVLSAATFAALAAWQRAPRERRRAEELLRLGQIGRLNTLGELSGGLAHELNQPLTAILTGTQAAQRLLDDDPPDLATARQAMALATTQARRAADVLARLRRLVEAPDAEPARQAVLLEVVVRNALNLLEPELRRRQIRAHVHLPRGQAPAVLADPTALDQVVHNLLTNAMRALQDVPVGERRLDLSIDSSDAYGRLSVHDSGPGIAPEALPHVFEPFYTTRRNRRHDSGLGLGLALCETLTQAMDGTLSARNVAPRGAEFTLKLPLAKVTT